MSRPSPIPQLGMTLIEVSLAMLLMVLLLSISMPNFSILMSSDLENETKRLAARIKEARTLAMLEGKRYKLMLDLKKNLYQFFQQDESQPSGYIPAKFSKQPFVLPQGITLVRVSPYRPEDGLSKFGFRAPRFDKIFGTTHEFVIDPSGLLDPFTLELKGKSQRQKLSVTKVTGKLSLSPPTPL